MKHLLADAVISGVQLRFLVWDNAAGTGNASETLAPLIERLGGRYIRSENIGVYRALNAMLDQAESAYVLIASSDVAMFGGGLAWMQDAMRQMPTVGWLGCRACPDDVSPLAADVTALSPGAESVRLGDFESHCALLNWTLLREKVGPFDERFFFTYGDTDYVERMRKADVPFGSISRPLCHHTRMGSRVLVDPATMTVLESWDREAFYQKWADDVDVMGRHKLPHDVGYETFLASAWLRRCARSFL